MPGVAYTHVLVDSGMVSILIPHELVRSGMGGATCRLPGWDDAFDCMKLNLTSLKTCGDGEREA